MDDPAAASGGGSGRPPASVPAENAIKASGHQSEIELRELSELVLEALDLSPLERAVAPTEEAPAP